MKRVIYLNVDKCNPPEVLLIEDRLETYYKLIGCDTIDIVTRRIGGKAFHVICDDEILIKKSLRSPFPRIGVYAPNDWSIYGNVVIIGYVNAVGEFTELSEDDCELILKKVRRHTPFYCPEGYYLIEQDGLK
ncbi:MAG: hypothetical protein IJY84_01390 [Clostridia bacterium]|nr:hypothetical protein [Clostridia bacterium]